MKFFKIVHGLELHMCAGEADQLLKSVEVLDEMKKKVQPNEITYSVLIVACER